MARDPEILQTRLGAQPLPRKADHLVTVYGADGSVYEVFPIDAREMCATGLYSFSPSPPASVDKPTKSNNPRTPSASVDKPTKSASEN